VLARDTYKQNHWIHLEYSNSIYQIRGLDMAYDIRMEIREGYLRVDVSGKREPGKEAERSIESWKDVARICKEHDLHAVLTILNLSGRLPVFAAYDIISTLSDVGLRGRYKLAVVDLNDASREDNLFAETVARNRGFSVRTFSNEEDALAWMLG